MSPIGSRPRSPYPTARDQHTQKAAATVIERYGIYRAQVEMFKKLDRFFEKFANYFIHNAHELKKSAYGQILRSKTLTTRENQKFLASYEYTWIPKTELVSLYTRTQRLARATSKTVRRAQPGLAAAQTLVPNLALESLFFFVVPK